MGAETGNIMPSLQEIKSDLTALTDLLGLPPRLGKCLCPFHADRNPSCRISRLDNGVVVYKCWSCGAHGTIVQAVAHKRSISETEAIQSLGCSAAEPVRQPNYRKLHSSSELGMSFPNPIPQRIDSVMNTIDERLHYWDLDPIPEFKERGIPLGVAHYYRFCFLNYAIIKGKEDQPIKSSWAIPIRDLNENIVGIKLHSEACGIKQKGGWLSMGKRSGCSAFVPNPETYDRDSLPAKVADWPDAWRHAFEKESEACRSLGLWTDDQIASDIEKQVRKSNKRKTPTLSDEVIFVLPGELKAFAMIGAGFHAVGLTAGESIAWPRALIKRLAGRKVCVVYDDDDAGKLFRERTILALKCKVTELYMMTFGKREYDGKVSKIDANDVARERGPAGLRKMVEWLLARKANLARKPFVLADERIELKRRMKEACQAKNGVFVFRPPVGVGKSFSASECVNESDAKFSIFAGSHNLAKEFVSRSSNALRLVSPKIASAEGLIIDEYGKSVDCPQLQRIENMYQNNLPYTAKACSDCPFRKGCPVITQLDKIEDSRVNILQHAHLKISKAKYFDDRVRIIDETAVNSFQWAVKFNDDKLESFKLLVYRFQVSEYGKNHSYRITAINNLIQHLKILDLAQSVTVAASIDHHFLGDWAKFLIHDQNETSFNLIPDLSRSKDEWIRCDIINGQRGYWMVRGELPDDSMPTIILDATAPAETYQTLFKGRTVTVWPDAEPPVPQSNVIQLIDGLYPRATLLHPETGKPLDAYRSIAAEIKMAMGALGVPENEVGLITLKRVTLFLKQDFPTARHMHFGALRGLNDMKDCRLVVVVGCQPMSDNDLAWQAAVMFRLNQTPETLIQKRRRKFIAVKAECGDGYEVNATDLTDPRLNHVWSISVTSELVQAIGRARPYEERAERQTVLVYCNQPLPMPVSRACTRSEFRAELGIGEPADSIARRVLDAMQRLKETDGAFGIKELTEKLGIGESTIKNSKYQTAVKEGCKFLDLNFKRNGDGQKGAFQS